MQSKFDVVKMRGNCLDSNGEEAQQLPRIDIEIKFGV